MAIKWVTTKVETPIIETIYISRAQDTVANCVTADGGTIRRSMSDTLDSHRDAAQVWAMYRRCNQIP